MTFFALWATGRASLAGSGYERGPASLLKFIGDVFSAGNSYQALLWASAAGSLVAVALALGQRILTLGDSVAAWVNGLKSMMMAILILVLAWSIADVCNALNTKGYMVALLSDALDPRLLPALVFVLDATPAFATGTSRAVLAGAIFGDHCSPISDTTVLSSTASGCDHVDHERTQLPYALIVAGVALLVGYLPTGYGLPPLVALLLASAALAAILLWRGKRRQG